MPELTDASLIKTYLIPVPPLMPGQNVADVLLREKNCAENILKVKITGAFNEQAVWCDPDQKSDGPLHVKFTATAETAQAMANAYSDRRVTDDKGVVVTSTIVSGRNVYAQPAKGF